MPFAIKLFKIIFTNDYYVDGESNDFYLIPDSNTQAFLEYHRMKLVTYNDKFELIWLTANFENPFQIFQQKITEYNLNFYLKIHSPYVINFSLLKVEQNSIYYFTNTNENQRLHKKLYVDNEDRIKFSSSMNSLTKPYQNVFGVVNIQLTNLWKEVADITQFPIKYTIHIQPRAVIWRYHIVDLYGHIKSPMKVVIDEDDSYFIYKGITEDKRIHLYESKVPIILSSKPTQIFSLKIYPLLTTDKTENTGNILLKKLPLPDVSSLEKNMEKGGIFYSNIVVYV